MKSFLSWCDDTGLLWNRTCDGCVVQKRSKHASKCEVFSFSVRAASLRDRFCDRKCVSASLRVFPT